MPPVSGRARLMNRRPCVFPIAIGVIATCCALLLPASALALQARLAWSATNASAGYKIYVRPIDGVYGTGLDTGAQDAGADGVVRVIVGNVSANMLFAVSTYDSGGVE